jgi:hypothetical protein
MSGSGITNLSAKGGFRSAKEIEKVKCQMSGVKNQNLARETWHINRYHLL